MFRRMFCSKAQSGLTIADLITLDQFCQDLPELHLVTLISGSSGLVAVLRRWRGDRVAHPATFIGRLSRNCVSAMICSPIPGDDENSKTTTINGATISQLTELLEEPLAVANDLVDEENECGCELTE
jgi:hypothetical protein